jgi:hypothetical protein
MKAIGYFGVPETPALFEATYLASPRKAGMPEEWFAVRGPLQRARMKLAHSRSK